MRDYAEWSDCTVTLEMIQFHHHHQACLIHYFDQRHADACYQHM